MLLSQGLFGKKRRGQFPSIRPAFSLIKKRDHCDERKGINDIEISLQPYKCRLSIAYSFLCGKNEEEEYLV